MIVHTCENDPKSEMIVNCNPDTPAEIGVTALRSALNWSKKISN